MGRHSTGGGAGGRSYPELQAETEGLRRSLSESLQQQTATSEILRVISTSPADVQPVFDVIARSAQRLCATEDVTIFRRDGDRMLLVAHHGSIPSGIVGEFALGPLRTLVEPAQIFHVADLRTESAFPEMGEAAQRLGFRATLAVPLLRDRVAIGAINLRRREARLFSPRHVELLQTFADQAVIAIENVRLFKELEARNRDLTGALEQQTATAEILRVISQSQTDVQSVFDTIVRNAVRLRGASKWRASIASMENLSIPWPTTDTQRNSSSIGGGSGPAR